MKIEKKLVDLENAKKGTLTKVGHVEMMAYELYLKMLVQVVRLDKEIEEIKKEIKKN